MAAIDESLAATDESSAAIDESLERRDEREYICYRGTAIIIIDKKALVKTRTMLPNKMNSTNNSSSFDYPAKVWFLTVAAAPFVYVLIMGIINSANTESFLESIPVLIVIIELGFTLAIPSLFLFWFLYVKVRTLKTTVWLQKALLSIAGIGLIALSFLAFDQAYFLNTQASSLMLPASYAIALVAAIFLVKMKAPPIY